MNIITTMLLSTCLFVENAYMSRYASLIASNRDTPHIPFKTQRHHIIPKYYFKRLGKEIDDTTDNVVNLMYCDHVLAHYYLAMCSLHGEDRYSNLCGVRRIIRGFSHREDEMALLLAMPEVQKCYEESLRGSRELHHHSDATKKKLSDAVSGRISIRDITDSHQKYVLPDELDDYLNDGWRIAHNQASDETKAKIGSKQRGRIRIKRNGEEKAIFPSQLDDYLKDGWERGINRNTPSAVKGRVTIHNGESVKMVTKESLQSFLNDGWLMGSGKQSPNTNKGKHLSDATRKKMSESRRGQIAIHKDGNIKYVKPCALDAFLSDGWAMGTGVSSKAVLGRIWITDGITSKYILPDELEIYIALGWRKGRVTKSMK